jgi:transcription elongation factor SPT6
MSSEEVPLVDNGEQETEKTVPEVKAEIDDDLPPIDSSDEEDSDEPNEYQEDGFVVNSESDEDLPDVDADDDGEKTGGRLRRLRKGGKRRHFELDQEDLDLVAVSKGFLPSTKLKKTVSDEADPRAPSSISVAKSASNRMVAPSTRGERGEATENVMDDLESDGEANSEDDDFLVDDSEDENEDAETRKQKRKARRNQATLAMNYEQFEDATLIYNDEWLQDLYDPTGDGLFDDAEFAIGGPVSEASKAGDDKFSVLRKQYEPEALKEMYLTEKDENIRLTDIPERFQLQYPNRPIPSDEEVAVEANWISDKLMSPNAMIGDNSLVAEKVKDVLTFLLCSHYEIPFIEHYRKEFWAPILTNADLWRIAELDHHWHNIQVRKQALQRSMPDEDAIAADLKLLDIKRRLETVSTDEAIQDLMDYYAHHSRISSSAASASAASASAAMQPLEDLVDDEVEVEKNFSSNLSKTPQHKRPVRADTRTLAREHKLDLFWQHLTLTPAQLAAAVMNPMQEKVEPSSASLYETPLEAAAAYVSLPTFATAKSVVDGACMLYAAELSVLPLFRARVAEHFDLYGVVSTKATVQGKLYIDLKHPYAGVRHLQHKPIGSFKNGTLFLTILKAVEEGLLEVSVCLQKEHVEQLLRELGSSFQLEMLESFAAGDETSAAFQWAQLRRKILLEAVNAVLPKLVARTKAKLHREATQVVLGQAEENLEKLIRAGPIPVPGTVTIKKASTTKKGRQHGLEDEVEYSPPLISICVGDPALSKEVLATVTVVDQSGELKETMSVLAGLRVEDSIALRELFRKHLPFAIAVGVDTPLAKKFFASITDLANAFVAEENLATPIKTIPMPLDVAAIFQTTKHADKEFNSSSLVAATPEAAVLLRRCASIARRLLNPLLEIAGLATQQDHLLGLDLHPLQKHVNQHALRRRLECAFVRVVSEVGVDLNRVLGHTWMQHVLQFVPGLGARKASSLVEGLLRGDSRVDSRAQLKDSAENSQLRPTEYLGPVVWDNAIAFLKICGNDNLYLPDWNPLDGTRIHPVAYAIAKKIGDDLSASGHIPQTNDPFAYVNAIARDPTLLRHVDLAAMIEKLKSKQVYKELTVRALVEELKSPFADPRIFEEASMSALFDLVVGKGNLDIGMVVTVRATFLDRQTQTWEVALPNFVNGTISSVDAPDDLRRGASVQAQVIGIDKELFKCQLTCHLTSSKWDATLVENRDPYLTPEPFDTSSISSGMLEALTKPSIVTRTIVHRHFANYSKSEAEEFLRPKPVGAYIIHPTSRKTMLTISSKFYFDTFAHISIEEVESGGFKIENEIYENIDDLVVRFMDPMLMNIKELEQHPCFKVLNKADMTTAIQAEKRAKPARAPYNIAPSQDKPGFFVLYYIPGSQTVNKEYLRVTPDGFRYRSITHKSVNRLIAYFKQHYNDPAYLAQQQRAQQNSQAAAYSAAPSAAYGQWPGTHAAYPPIVSENMGYNY